MARKTVLELQISVEIDPQCHSDAGIALVATADVDVRLDPIYRYIPIPPNEFTNKDAVRVKIDNGINEILAAVECAVKTERARRSSLSERVKEEIKRKLKELKDEGYVVH